MRFAVIAAVLLTAPMVRASGDKAEQQKDVTVLDVYEGAAVAKVVASGWVDYLSLAKWNGKWKIVNVLWELKPRPAEPQAAPKQ